MDDLISRQEAIDAVNTALFPKINTAKDAEKALRNLPPAQPETHEERTETHTCDLISRQAVIEAINKIFPADPMRDDYTQGITCGAALANVYVAQLPSAQPETHEERTETHACDCISRKAAIVEIARWIGYIDEDMINRIQIGLNRLPSAQSEPIRINLNEPIKVKLTDWGKEIYYHQYDRTNQIAGKEICKPMFPREDENGYTEFQLWCFIELYGMHMGMTLPNVIEPLEIVYER